jgi:hypothetical protein
MYPKIPYALPHKDLNKFKRITRAYARQIGALPLSPLLPQKKQIRRLVVDTLDEVFVHTVEDLIDFSLTEIEQPLNMIPETPAYNYSEPDNFESEEEKSNSNCSGSESKDMGG